MGILKTVQRIHSAFLYYNHTANFVEPCGRMYYNYFKIL